MLEAAEGGTLLKLWVQPGASRTRVAGEHGGRLKIQVAAPPVEGAANDELLGFLRKQLGVPRSALELVRGAASRQKDVLCRGVAPREARVLLGLK